jgi:hypothetical protein
MQHSGTAHTNWTHRYKESGQPADYQLYDLILVSNALAGRVTGHGFIGGNI